MKNRTPLAPSRDLGIGPDAELTKLADGITEALSAARVRMERGAAAREDTSGSEARSAQSAPSTNRGGKSLIGARLVLNDGEVVEIPARRTWGAQTAFLDWVNFVTDESDFFFGTAPVSDVDVMDKISYRCKEIFGFGITEERATGANFYHRSYKLAEYGMVCIGGQRSTVLVMLTGEGCAAAREGWEGRLYDFLTKCGPRARLTRVDLSHDFYNGEVCGPVREGEMLGYSVDQADCDYDNGSFCNGGRIPDIEHRGNWKRLNGKGRTVYVGHRANGKYARIYEKGKQLGDKNSPWVRVEVEMKAVNRLLPFDILLKAGEYLAATYPAFAFLSATQERILTTQKATEIKYQNMLDWLKRQCGAALNCAQEIEGSPEAVMKMLVKPGCIPSRLKMPDYRFADEAIHERVRPAVNEEQFFASAFA